MFLHKAETSSVLLGALFIQLQATFTSAFWVGCNLWNVSYKGCGQAAGNRDAVNPGIFRLCRGSLQWNTCRLKTNISFPLFAAATRSCCKSVWRRVCICVSHSEHLADGTPGSICVSVCMQLIKNHNCSWSQRAEVTAGLIFSPPTPWITEYQ